MVAALFVLLLAVTGILLNHSHALGFDKKPLQASIWRYVYAAPVQTSVQGFRVGAHWLSSQGGKLYFDNTPLADCDSLLGALGRGGQILVVCPRLLLLLTPEGQIIDQADALRGVPSGLSAVGRRGDMLLLYSDSETFSVTLHDLSVRGVDMTAEEFVRPAILPGPLQRSSLPPELTHERLLQDLHSGRILGAWGPWLMDCMAFLFAVMAISGVSLAGSHHRH